LDFGNLASIQFAEGFHPSQVGGVMVASGVNIQLNALRKRNALWLTWLFQATAC